MAAGFQIDALSVEVGLIGLAGGAGAGKTAAAGILAGLGFTRRSFAMPIKQAAASILTSAGVAPAEAWRLLAEAKDTPCPALEGRSVRYLLQTLGSEWGRDFWVRLALRETPLAPLQVFDDVRFSIEVAPIRAAGGEIWQIVGRGADMVAAEAGHTTERGLPADLVDRVIENDRDLDTLEARILEALFG